MIPSSEKRWLAPIFFLLLETALGQEKGAPLTETERREVLLRLHELRVAKAEAAVLHDHLDRRDALDAREKAAWERSLELEKRATGLAERETVIERQRADFAEAALKAATRGRSWPCKYVKKPLSLWMSRCN